MEKVFYHASIKPDLKELLPCSRRIDKKVCYFTPYRSYAIFYLRDLEINHVTCGVSKQGTTIYYEQFPRQLEVIYQHRSGYLYSCQDNTSMMKAAATGIYYSEKAISVASVDYIEDVYGEILHAEQTGEVRIVRYEMLDDDAKNEITKTICKLLIDENCFLGNSSKVHFFSHYFPQAWELAKASNNLK